MAISSIDGEKCVGCGACAQSCPMDVISRDSSPTGASALSPCRLACPARIDIKGYIRLLGEGKMEEAIRLIREESPLPAVTGHVCFHPCEEGCSRSEVDRPVNINGLERYVADYWLNEKAEACMRIHDKRVSVIGSGPAGLAAAYVIARKGYPVTVFEGDDKPGGMLRTGIPEYRLPQSVLDAQIDYVRHLGVEFKNGVVFGKDLNLEKLKAAGFDAVLLAIGAQLSRTLAIPGADAPGVLWGLDFLRAVKLGKDVLVGPRTVVVGGGNVAVDAALTALRLGSEKVRIVCLESEDQMPAHREVFEMATEEGVDVSPGWGPKRVAVKSGRVAGIEVVRCLSVFDEKGSFSPCLDDEAKKLFETDSVIFAIGETMDASSLPPGIETRYGHILVDPLTMETNLSGVFAAGLRSVGLVRWLRPSRPARRPPFR